MRLGVVMIANVFYPSIGGAQTHTLRLSQKLQARGLDVLVLTRHHPGLARYEEVGGVPTFRVGGTSGGKAGAALSFISGALAVLRAQRRRFQVIHSHQMVAPMTIGLMALPLTGARLVINPHRSSAIGDIGVLTRRRPVTGRVRIAAARRWGDAFVSISGEIHDELRGVGVPEAKIWDIPNGVDPEHYRPAAAEERAALRRELGLPAGPLLAFVGRLTHAKGLDVLLDAWPQVRAQAPGVRLALVGEGELRAELEARARPFGDEVIFTGGCSDTAPYLRAADAFVLPSRAEGMPVALLEAMACGLPCVATAVSGSSQLVDDGDCGRLVPVEDPAALGGALAEALLPAAAEWGARARQRILGSYALDVVADRYVAMYESLAPLDGRRAPAAT